MTLGYTNERRSLEYFLEPVTALQAERHSRIPRRITTPLEWVLAPKYL